MIESIPALAINTFNFVLLVLGLTWILRKPISRFLVSRSSKIENNLQESQELRDEALEMLSNYKEKVSRLDTEVENILEKAKQNGQKEKEKILKRAEMLAQQIVDNAKRNAEREAQNLRDNIENQFMEKALEKARQNILEKVSPSEHQVFVDYFLTQMEKNDGLNK